MASVFDRIAKRKAYPVELNGGTLFVCEPTLRQVKQVQSLDGERATGMALANCIVNDDGSPVFERNDGETDSDFADRVLEDASVLTPSELSKIHDAIAKLVTRANHEELTKN